MISKNLVIAAAILFLSGAGAGGAFAQGANPPAGQTATQPATPDTGTGNAAAPGATTPAGAADQNTAGGAAPNASPAAAAPPPAAPAPAAGGTGATTVKENPYGLRQLWEGQNGHADWVARGVMIL